MSYHEMACDAGYGPKHPDHAAMEVMAEAEERAEQEAREQAQAEELAADADREMGIDDSLEDVGNK